MPRYFFHLRTDNDLHRDPVGSDHPDLDAAHAQAAEIGRSLLSVAVSRGEDPHLPRSIEITDESGADQLYLIFWADFVPQEKARKEDILTNAAVH